MSLDYRVPGGIHLNLNLFQVDCKMANKYILTREGPLGHSECSEVSVPAQKKSVKRPAQRAGGGDEFLLESAASAP